MITETYQSRVDNKQGWVELHFLDVNSFASNEERDQDLQHIRDESHNEAKSSRQPQTVVQNQTLGKEDALRSRR